MIEIIQKGFQEYPIISQCCLVVTTIMASYGIYSLFRNVKKREGYLDAIYKITQVCSLLYVLIFANNIISSYELKRINEEKNNAITGKYEAEISRIISNINEENAKQEVRRALEEKQHAENTLKSINININANLDTIKSLVSQRDKSIHEKNKLEITKRRLKENIKNIEYNKKILTVELFFINMKNRLFMYIMELDIKYAKAKHKDDAIKYIYEFKKKFNKTLREIVIEVATDVKFNFNDKNIDNTYNLLVYLANTDIYLGTKIDTSYATKAMDIYFKNSYFMATSLAQDRNIVVDIVSSTLEEDLKYISSFIDTSKDVILNTIKQ